MCFLLLNRCIFSMLILDNALICQFFILLSNLLCLVRLSIHLFWAIFPVILIVWLLQTLLNWIHLLLLLWWLWWILLLLIKCSNMRLRSLYHLLGVTLVGWFLRLNWMTWMMRLIYHNLQLILSLLNLV